MCANEPYLGQRHERSSRRGIRGPATDGRPMSGSEYGFAHHLSGVRVARVCCALVALLLVAAVVYGGVMVFENYGHIAV